MSSYYFISFVGALQGVLLSLVFLFRKGYHPAARVLGAYVLVFSLGLLERFSANTLQGYPREIVAGFLGWSNFLYGPLLYLSIAVLTSDAPKIKRSYLYHIIPFALGYMLTLISAANGDLQNGKADGIVEMVLFEVFVVHLLTYNILAIKKLAAFRQRVLQTYSSPGAKDLDWLRFYVMFITGIYVLSIAITHLVAFGIKAERLYVMVQLGITVAIYLMSYRIVFQPGMFSVVPQTVVPEAETTEEKYQRSGLKTEQAAGYAGKLLSFMESSKPYLDQELTIYTLAEQLDISRNHLTQVINEELGKNFYEFINAYRVEEVKRLMEDRAYDHYTLSGLGLEAGFKSKTAFNTNFKKLAGVTPTEWKKNHQIPAELGTAKVPVSSH